MGHVSSGGGCEKEDEDRAHDRSREEVNRDTNDYVVCVLRRYVRSDFNHPRREQADVSGAFSLEGRSCARRLYVSWQFLPDVVELRAAANQPKWSWLVFEFINKCRCCPTVVIGQTQLIRSAVKGDDNHHPALHPFIVNTTGGQAGHPFPSLLEHEKHNPRPVGLPDRLDTATVAAQN